MIKAKIRGGVTLIDDLDYEKIKHFAWFVDPHGYVVRHERVNKRRKVHFLHRSLMNPTKELEVDHIDRNKLNNQRSNLRICTHSQNATNCGPRGKNPFKGVYDYPRLPGVYRVYIKWKGKQIFIGCFKNMIHAAMAYDIWARDLHGEFAYLNFPNYIGSNAS